MDGLGSTTASFSYFHFNPAVHKIEKPYEILVNLEVPEEKKAKFRRSNQEFATHQVEVHDARGREHDFSLDSQGVCWRNWRGPQNWQGLNAETIQGKGHEWLNTEYLQPAESFIKDELARQEGKAPDVVKVFNYKLRTSKDLENFNTRTVNLEDGLDPMIPVTHPHVDQSFDGAVKRVLYHHSRQATDLLKRRFRIINLWKPLCTVKTWPLGICDTSSVNVDDLIPSDIVRRQFIGESFYSKYNPNHRWYYLSNQLPEEVTMLKIFDSDPAAKVRYVNPADVRESFEIRALVFDDPDSTQASA